MGVGGGRGGGGGGSTESSLWATLAPNLEDSQEMLILAPVHSDCPSSRITVFYWALFFFFVFFFSFLLLLWASTENSQAADGVMVSS